MRIGLKGFAGYSICPRTFRIFSSKKGKDREVPPSKRHTSELTYILHQNGIPCVVTYWEILVLNWDRIVESRNLLTESA